MTESQKSEKGFFDRWPILGSGGFLLIAIVTGVILVQVIGERPHFRGQDWKLFTKIPPAGTGMAGGSARCLMAREFRGDPIRIVTLANVVDELGRPCGHHEVILTTASRTRLISYGVTEPLGGSLHLAIPARLEQLLFNGQVEAVVLLPGLSPIAATVPPPKNSRTAVTLKVPPSRTADIRLHRNDGMPFTDEVQILVSAAGQERHALSRGFRVLGGRTRIGGLPDDLTLLLQVSAPGHENGDNLLRFPAQAGKVATQDVFLGAKLSQFKAQLEDPSGAPLSGTKIRAAWAGEHRDVETDENGNLSFRCKAVTNTPLEMRLATTNADPAPLGTQVDRRFLAPGESWDAGTLRLKPQPEAGPLVTESAGGSDNVSVPSPRPMTGGGQVVVQHPDGLPVQRALVCWAGAQANPAPWSTDMMGKITVGSSMGTESTALLARTESGYAFKENPKFPLFLALRPFGSTIISLKGLSGPAQDAWLFVELEPDGAKAPGAVRRLMSPKPTPVSSRHHCRIPRLLPGAWTAWLKIHSRDPDRPPRRIQLGSITIPESGDPVPVKFRVDLGPK